MGQIFIPGTASTGDVLSGKVFNAGTNYQASGTMPNKSGNTQLLSTLDDGSGNKGSYIDSVIDADSSDQALNITITPPQGYYDGSTAKIKLRVWGPKSNVIAAGQKVGWTNSPTVTGTYTSDANATPGDILSGKTAYVNGQKITGTMPQLTSYSQLLNWENDNADQRVAVTIPKGYSDGTVKFDIAEGNLSPSNIVSGKSIFGVAGTAVVGKRYAIGTTFVSNMNLSVTGLGFKPTTIVIYYVSSGGNLIGGCQVRQFYKEGWPLNDVAVYYYSGSSTANGYNFSVNSNGFSCFVGGAGGSGTNVNWIAYE